MVSDKAAMAGFSQLCPDAIGHCGIRSGRFHKGRAAGPVRHGFQRQTAA